MKRVRTYGIILLLLAVLLSGCSAESMMEKGAGLLDKMFAGDSSEPREPAKQPESPEPDTDPEPAGQEPGHSPEAVEPSIPEEPPVSAEPPVTEPVQPAPAGDVTPSHTDATFFGPGESFRYLPKGIDGVYACTYASEDETVASVDPATGKVTAVGPGTTKVTMHVEYNGQYDFECIVRCNWEADEKEPSLPGEPALPPASAEPVDTTGTAAISASHSDATFFNPKEHFQLLPVGAGDDYACSYATADAGIASVDEKGVVTAVGPGTTTVTMTLDAGGTEYIFKCIVRCNWSSEKQE